MDREAQLERLREGPFDILVIGGGATGTGVALDAASRGLKVALAERDDFASGTSSRSTKLIHGGVRYLEQAVKKFDRSQFKLVRDALRERATLLRIAPHLTHALPLVTPLYNRLEVPYYLTGLKLYDWLAGKANLQPSRFVDAREALNRFPMLKAEGLRGGVIYYDGQFDDARMNVTLALTAASQGAAVVNHLEVTGLFKENGRLAGARVRDHLSDQGWEIQAKVVINATGPFSDAIRHLDDPDASPMLSASSGVHIVLAGRFSPPETGLLIPQTEDGRVLFLLPWLEHTLVGTTDNPAAIEANPKAGEADIAYILRHLHKYFALPVSESDVLASWAGLRPLVSDPKAADTARLSRDHVINISASGLLTIAGGKWTTYRKMAQDAVDEAVKLAGFSPARDSQTATLELYGAENYHPSDVAKLQDCGLALTVASYLSHAYGDQAEKVIALGHLDRLAAGHPYLEAEVIYGARYEAARTVRDVLARRLRLAFLDHEATLAAIPKVAELLAGELGWSAEKRQTEEAAAFSYFS